MMETEKSENKKASFLTMFISFFYIGLVTIGGFSYASDNGRRICK